MEIPEERLYLVQLLRDSQREYLSSIDDVTEAQWNWRPRPERWSVGQVAEHILLAELALFTGVQRAIQNPVDADSVTKTNGKTELLEQVMLDRSRKAVAPERVQPQGLSKAEVLCRFKELRANTINFVERTQIPLQEHTAEHPFPVFRTLNAYQWLLYIPLHALRHQQQIVEIKATPGYPK